MKKFPKILLLLLVLAPSVFFLSRAFAATTAQIIDQKLVVTGPGSFELPLDEIEEIGQVQQLPELSGTGGLSLGLIKKGNFIRASDQAAVRVIKNRDTDFVHLVTKGKEVYFNLKSRKETEELYKALLENRK